MPLPQAWIERIFEKLTLVYGHHFLGRWVGLDMGKVKADWAIELEDFGRNPEAIAYALQHLPVDPPNVVELRKLMRAAPPRSVPLLGHQGVPMPAEVKERMRRVRGALLSPHDARARISGAS